MIAHCPLCDPNLGPVIAGSAYWQLVLNRNQNLLGKCFLALRRHLEAVPELSAAEWADLHGRLAQATRVLTAAFQPDHFSYAFLQNRDRHIHLHVIPRYGGPRLFAGVTFADPDFPAHYAVPAPSRTLTPEQTAVLAWRLRRLCAETERCPSSPPGGLARDG